MTDQPDLSHVINTVAFFTERALGALKSVSTTDADVMVDYSIAMLEKLREAYEHLPDLNLTEAAVLALLAVVVVWAGIHPHTFVSVYSPDTAAIAQKLLDAEQVSLLIR